MLVILLPPKLLKNMIKKWRYHNFDKFTNSWIQQVLLFSTLLLPYMIMYFLDYVFQMMMAFDT
jgi:hypothetical protein